MADTVTNTVLYNGPKRMVVTSVFTIDGVEATVILADKSGLTGPDLTEPGRLVIEKMEWALSGMQVLLAFDHTTDDKIAELSGEGVIDYTKDGQFPGFIDPASAGDTGDIIATTQTTDAGDQGTIVLYLRKKD